MKHLLTGVAIAAALAIAAPAWAQAPAAAPAAPAAAPKAAAAPMASKQRHKRVVHRGVASRRRGGRMQGGGDAMTEQLNREELARIQGGGGPPGAPMPMPMPPPPPPSSQGPRPSSTGGYTTR